MKLVILETVYPDWGSPYESPTFVEYSSAEDLRKDLLEDIEKAKNHEKVYWNKWNIWNQANQSKQNKIRCSTANIDWATKQLIDLSLIPVEKRPAHYSKLVESMNNKIHKERANIERYKQTDIGEEPLKSYSRRFNLFINESSVIISLDEWFARKCVKP
jgi:hypothetical protein